MAITLRYEKSSQSWSLVSSVFGFAFGVVALLIVAKLPIDVYRERDHWMAPDIKERGIDLLVPIWHFMDLTPQGRGNWYASLDYGTKVRAAST